MTKSKLRRSIHLINLKAEKALKEAVAETIRDHQQTGHPLAIWRNGKAVWVSANKLLARKSRRKVIKKS